MKKDTDLFKLLINISASSESTLERLSTTLKMFIDKYFVIKDFTPPSSPIDTVINTILQVEAVLYTCYELDKKAKKEREKLEIFYYKDLVLKSLFVLTNMDFYIDALIHNNLYKDACDLRDQLEEAFRKESDKFDKTDIEDVFESIELDSKKVYKDVTPSEYRRARDFKDIDKEELAKESTKEDLQLHEVDPTIAVEDGVFDAQVATEPQSEEDVISEEEEVEEDYSSGDELDFLFIPEDLLEEEEREEEERLKNEMMDGFQPLQNLKKIIRERSKITEPPVKLEENKVRTSMGWEISTDQLNNLYGDLKLD